MNEVCPGCDAAQKEVKAEMEALRGTLNKDVSTSKKTARELIRKHGEEPIRGTLKSHKKGKHLEKELAEHLTAGAVAEVALDVALV